jgi:hypothetical protein
MDIRACLFDVFGTVVAWRISVMPEWAAFRKLSPPGESKLARKPFRPH